MEQADLLKPGRLGNASRLHRTSVRPVAYQRLVDGRTERKEEREPEGESRRLTSLVSDRLVSKIVHCIRHFDAILLILKMLFYCQSVSINGSIAHLMCNY